MAEAAEFTIGAKANCSDGFCGEVSRVIIDPSTRTITHLVIEPKHRREPGRLVPVGLVDATLGEIGLRCTLAEFGRLDVADEIDQVQGRGAGVPEPTGRPPMGVSHPARVVVHDVVPLGEVEVGHGEPVHALDGQIGRVQGFVVDPDDHRVTHVLLQEGHFWGRKEVAIPVSAVARVDDGIRLSITRQQVEGLPPVG
jgi:sporulation protein YlmC with PRC-barrel domain